jgi:hypothetical protein
VFRQKTLNIRQKSFRKIVANAQDIFNPMKKVLHKEKNTEIPPKSVNMPLVLVTSNDGDRQFLI